MNKKITTMAKKRLATRGDGIEYLPPFKFIYEKRLAVQVVSAIADRPRGV